MNLQNFRIEKQLAPSNDWKVFGASASVSAVLAYLTMPFKDTMANSLKVGK